MGLILGLRKIPRAAKQLSPCTATTKPLSCILKPMCLEPVLCNKRSHHDEKPTHCSEEEPPVAATRESPHTATKTSRAKNNLKKLRI